MRVLIARFIQRKATRVFKKKNGFTLVEVITSIAILSIVSATLLRTFTVSAETNRIAREMDSANAVCIETAEKFKDDPNPSTGILSSFADLSGAYALYYNASFDRDKTSTTQINSGDADEATKGLSAYKVIVTPTKVTTPNMSDYYYPDPAFSIDAVNGVLAVNLTKSGESGCLLAGTIPNAAGKIVYSTSTMTAMVPVHVDCHGLLTDSTIEVNNLIGELKDPDSGLEMIAIADFYLYNIEAHSVDVEAVEGISTSSIISKGAKRMVEYSALIQVERLSENRIFTEYNVKKYHVEEVMP